MKKKSILLSAFASIAICLSIICGTTYALFTSESEANIAVTSGKVDVKANVDDKNVIVGSTLGEINSALNTRFNDEQEFVIENTIPGDEVTFPIHVVNNSSIDIKYRLGMEVVGDLKDFLLIGISSSLEGDYVYYTKSVSDWETWKFPTEESAKVKTLFVKVMLPEYVGNEAQDIKNSAIAFKVEAIQGNGSTTGTAVANQAYLLNSQEELNIALESIKTGDTLVLMEKNVDWTIETTRELSIDVRGFNINQLDLNGENLELNLYNAYTATLNVLAVAGDSLHVFGNVGNLLLNGGRAVVEAGAEVVKAVVEPSKSKEAILEIVENAVASAVEVPRNEGTAKIVNAGLVHSLKSNSTNVIVDDSASTIEKIEGNVVKVAHVTNEQELKNAVAKGGPIVLDNDFEISSIIEVIKSTTIDGNGHSIVSSASRILWIDSSNVELNLFNVKLLRNGNDAVERAVQVNPDMVGVKINIEGCILEASYYTINICNGADVALTIDNSEITGWGAINAWSAGYKIKVSNSILRGVNDKGYNAEGWNGFGTVVLEGDTTGKTENGAEAVDVELVNCRIIAESKTGNIQKCILFNSKSKGNNVKVVDCSLELENEKCLEVIINGTENSLIIVDSSTNTAKVYNEFGLFKALDNSEYQTVALANDIILNDATLRINRPVVLDGNGHTVLAQGFTNDNYCIVNILASDCDVEICNAKFVAESVVPYMRGINLSGTNNLNLVLNKVDVELNDYYAFNITLYNHGLNIVMNNSSISGWGAVKNHSSGVTFTATNSTFIGLNPHDSPNSTGNYFTTIIPSNYVLYDDETFVEDYLSANNTFTFNTCTIVARIGNKEDGTLLDTRQSLIDLRSPYNNVVNLNDCTLVAEGGNDKIVSAYDSTYIPEENRGDSTFVVDTNKVIINGVDSTNDSSIVEKYLDE